MKRRVLRSNARRKALPPISKTSKFHLIEASTKRYADERSILKSSSVKSTETIDFIHRISNFNTRERQFAKEKWSHRYRKSKYY